MKLLYHHRTQAEDGQAVHIRSMIAALRAEGHEVREEALVAKADGEPPAKIEEASRSWSWIGRIPRFVRELAEYGYSVPATRRLVRAGREFSPTAIYERYAFGNSAGVRAARSLGVPLVLEVNSPMVLELSKTRGLSFPNMAARVETNIFTGATRVCVVTAVLGEMLVELGVERERLIVTPNGVHPEQYSDPDPVAARAALGLPADTGPVLGFTGYYRDWHRLDLVVEALTDPVLSEARLVLVGAGPAEDNLRAAAARCGVADRVHFAGSRPHAAIPGLLPAFDVGLVPAINPYASPLKLHEYMAAGVATIAPDQPNLREVLTHRRDALLVPPGDGDALRQALVELVANPKLRGELGRAAAAAIVTRDLTWRGNARRVVAAIEGLA